MQACNMLIFSKNFELKFRYAYTWFEKCLVLPAFYQKTKHFFRAVHTGYQRFFYICSAAWAGGESDK